MKKIQSKNKIALALMSSSLLCLGIFLAVWVQDLYQEEVERLQEKSSFIFINSLQKAESSLLRAELLSAFKGIETVIGDSIKLDLSSFNINMEDDENETRIYERFDTSGLIETKVEIRVGDKPHNSKHKKTLGNIATWIIEANDSISFDSLSLTFKDSFLTASIKNIIKDAPKMKELPNEFRVIKIKDSTTQIKSIISEVYKDHDSGDQFALAFDKPDGYIFNKIIPEILFSLFLFTITTLAFFFIYKNLRDQQQLTEVKNDLIANITHELKTPIATVGVAIEALLNFGALEDPKRTKEYLEISQQELNRLSILVDKVLNTSLFEKGDIPLKSESINLKLLVQGVLNSMKLQFQNKDAVINFVSKGDEFTIKGDKIHLTSVVYNLIDNALKYSPLSPKLNINLEAKAAQIIFQVKDNGLGIPKEFQTKIFDKFFRVPTGNAHNIKGHGLGLNYVKKVIEKHGGQIAVYSKQGQGTEFIISLPN